MLTVPQSSPSSVSNNPINMKRKGAKIRKGKKLRVEIVYIPKSKWPKKVLAMIERLKTTNPIKNT